MADENQSIPIGYVSRIEGVATSEEGRPFEEGQPVFLHTQVQTGTGGSVQIQFINGSQMALGSGKAAKVCEYYQPESLQPELDPAARAVLAGDPTLELPPPTAGLSAIEVIDTPDDPTFILSPPMVGDPVSGTGSSSIQSGSRVTRISRLGNIETGFETEGFTPAITGPPSVTENQIPGAVAVPVPTVPAILPTDHNGGAPPDANGHNSVWEAGLLTAASTETTTGTIIVSAPAGLGSISVGGTSLSTAQLAALTPAAPVVINTGEGSLSLTGYNSSSGVLSYSYSLLAVQNQPGATDSLDGIALAVTDLRGETGSGTLRIQIIDDVPVAAADSSSITEDALTNSVGGSVLTNDYVGADANPNPVTPANVSLTYGSLVLASDGTYTYTLDNGNAAVNALKDGQTLTDRYSYTLTDADGDTRTAVLSIVIQGADDLPVTDLNGPGVGADNTAAFTEQISVRIAPAGTVTDIDSANLSSMTVILGSRPNGNGAESLSLDTTAANAATAAGLTVAYTANTGVLLINGSAPQATYQSILQGILYSNTSDTPDTTDRSVTVVVNDGTGNSAITTSTISVTPVNDAPVNSIPGIQAATEDTTQAITGLSIADVDAGAGELRVSLNVTHGTLNVSGGSAIIAGSGTDTVTLTGTVTAINATLGARVEYVPTVDYYGGATLTMTTSDNGNSGVGGALTDVDTLNILITSVDDIASDTGINNAGITVMDSVPTSFNVLTGANGGTADNFENPDRQVTSVTQPAHGTVAFTPDGVLTYAPESNWLGDYTFSYTVTSGGATETAQVKVHVVATPLVLDLNGDGVHSLGLEAGIAFDVNADGTSNRTGWVSPEDGLLVRDLSGDGVINDGSELFGSGTSDGQGGRAGDGFEALSLLDDNRDGVIDSNDAAWSELRVWQDRDTDGFTDNGELAGLESLGIQSLNLTFTTSDATENGNLHGLVGSYATSNGQSHEMTDVFFATGAPVPDEAIPTLTEVVGLAAAGVEDHIPLLTDVATPLDESPAPATHLVLVIDTSASMGRIINNSLETRLDQAIEAAQQLIEGLDADGGVNVRIIGFNASAQILTGADWVDGTAASELLGGLQAGADDSRDYEVALEQAMSIDPATASQSLFYFFADGVPNAGELDNVAADWQAFAAAHFDNVQVFGLGGDFGTPAGFPPITAGSGIQDSAQGFEWDRSGILTLDENGATTWHNVHWSVSPETETLTATRNGVELLSIEMTDPNLGGAFVVSQQVPLTDVASIRVPYSLSGQSGGNISLDIVDARIASAPAAGPADEMTTDILIFDGTDDAGRGGTGTGLSFFESTVDLSGLAIPTLDEVEALRLDSNTNAGLIPLLDLIDIARDRADALFVEGNQDNGIRIGLDIHGEPQPQQDLYGQEDDHQITGISGLSGHGYALYVDQDINPHAAAMP